MHLLRNHLVASRFGPKALLVIALVAAAGQASVTPAAAAPAPRTCAPAQPGGACAATAEDSLQLAVPDGAQQCPASGPGASCVTSNGGGLTPGISSTPDGQTPCPSPLTSPLSTPAACATTGGGATPEPKGAPASAPSVEPSVPVSTLRPAATIQKLTLETSASSAPTGAGVVLTATSPLDVTGSGDALEIFDTTTGTLVGSCEQGARCSVGYSADAGVHTFQAFVVPPTSLLPAKAAVSSNSVPVGWVGVTLTADNHLVGAGKATILTATSTVPVEQFGYAIQIFDAATMNRITYCARGTNCSVSVSNPVTGSRSVVATVGAPATTFSAAAGQVVSGQVALTWLSVALEGSSTYQAGGTIHLTATASGDVTDTPWSIGIVDDSGHLVGAPCKSGTTCTADVTVTSPSAVRFSAVVGSVPTLRAGDKVADLLTKVAGPSSLVNIQAQSAAIQPTRLLWGVDSCKAFTGDPTGEVYPGVAGGLGTPDFWGRYLTTTMCPAISPAEVGLAHSQHIAILPIYNDYDCSNVSGYDTARGYAAAAVAAAQALSIPAGRVVAVDIEPPGDACPGAANVDADFIRGWYDCVTAAGYVPVYYGNGTAGSEFGSAYCAAQAQNNAIGNNAYIWSFEPSLVSPGLSKANAPEWQPYDPGCRAHLGAWQYQIDVFSPNPNVDSDEALSTLPLWYP